MSRGWTIVKRIGRKARLGALLGGLLPLTMSGAQETPNAASAAAPEPLPEPLEEIVVAVPEPRYVSPTRRDQIGRIWAPVYINDQGPFRLVLDTGATHSGVIAAVAAALKLPPNTAANVVLRGVTGSAVVPTIRVDSLRIGDLLLTGRQLPIIIDALGGAQGILGTEGLTDKRVFIDFRNDLIMIKRSRNERAAPGYTTIPIKFEHGRLLTTEAQIGAVRAKAIIDTGGQATIANGALRNALYRRAQEPRNLVPVIGTTDDVQNGEDFSAPTIVLGDLRIRGSRIIYGDMHIFEHWKMTEEPAILIGMDTLGLLDTLIIDYKRSELQIRTRSGS